MTLGSERTDGSLAFEPARALARRIREKEVSPGEVAETFLERIAALNPRLNAYLTVDETWVRQSAAAAEEALMGGAELGPLHGLPVAVKDLENTRGLRTTSGTAAYAGFEPDEDSVLVERLRGAGAIVLGKTNTPAFGLLGETKNRLGDDCRNPWDTGRTTGGSSGGSAAAVASGLAPLATGTDSAGSITQPAGMCGVYGIKPTHGRVPTWPNGGDSLTLADGGPLTRTVEDAALMLSVLAGRDGRDPISLRETPPDFLGAAESRVSGLRIAYSPDLGHFPVDPEVREVTAAAARAFAEVGSEPDDATPRVENPFVSYMPVYLSDAQAALADFLKENADELFPETLCELEGSDRITGAEVARNWARLHRFRSDMADFFSDYDLLLTPASAVAAFPVREPPGMIGGQQVEPGWRTFMPFQIAWNLTGQPVASVPCGFTSGGLPVGLLIVGPWGREDLVLAASFAFERIRPWRDRLPPIVASAKELI